MNIEIRLLRFSTDFAYDNIYKCLIPHDVIDMLRITATSAMPLIAIHIWMKEENGVESQFTYVSKA